ncbi:hypothetical protein Moror_8048 [Moniliophthora roreri MCA 2997]|uniref:Uncharacterized protein n=2 Tax=Moniliophthora roreri TaxID=221103 RepID=V2XPC6_MONRO|nr:hypothetical protein Moror_8048 [Moniliophthora roreri MCA 2997]KAI3612224.1 hypothetical protein WG66_012209 [Moniliophthora roreri]
MSTFETIDDRDLRIIYFGDSWEPALAPPPFGITVHKTNRPAQADFTFEASKGHSVKVMSVAEKTRTNGPTVNFTVDGCESSVHEQTLNSPGETSYRTVFNCVTTADGNHTLRINVLKVTKHPFMLDTIELRGPTNDTTESFSAAPSAENGPTETSNTSNASSGSTRKVNVGGIVGGVIAALVILAMLVVFILYRKRKLERSQRSPQITPFNITPVLTSMPVTPLPTAAVPPPPPTHSLRIEQDRSPAILEDELPPPFVAGNSRDIPRRGSTYKPRRSIDSLPPTEYGYGGGLREWSSENRH